MATKPTTAVTIAAPDERMAELLCSAYEGGSSYWARQDDGKASPYRLVGPVSSLAGRPVGALELVPDFDVEITDIEGDGKKHRLTLRKLRAGLQAMATKYPRHFCAFLEENDDAVTGDVFLQCALFGELIYG